MKNFRLLIVCAFLIFLDIPSPSNACRDDRTGLEVDVLVVDNENIMFRSSELKLNTQTTHIDEALVKRCVEGSLRTGTVYVEEDNKQYDIDVTSYNIESIILVKNDRTEVEIELPYEFSKEDITVYLAGKRNFIQLHVNISLEYVMIIPEPDTTLE